MRTLTSQNNLNQWHFTKCNSNHSLVKTITYNSSFWANLIYIISRLKGVFSVLKISIDSKNKEIQIESATDYGNITIWRQSCSINASCNLVGLYNPIELTKTLVCSCGFCFIGYFKISQVSPKSTKIRHTHKHQQRESEKKTLTRCKIHMKSRRYR